MRTTAAMMDIIGALLLAVWAKGLIAETRQALLDDGGCLSQYAPRARGASSVGPYLISYTASEPLTS